MGPEFWNFLNWALLIVNSKIFEINIYSGDLPPSPRKVLKLKKKINVHNHIILGRECSGISLLNLNNWVVGITTPPYMMKLWEKEITFVKNMEMEDVLRKELRN